MIHKNIILFIAIFFVTNKIASQVNLQTGNAVYNLPIFSWQDNKSRLNLNVSLNYNSGNGLKTGEVASNVGQGWNLIAGGCISRMQVGLPDDQKPYDVNNNSISDLTKYPAGYLYNTVDASNGCPNALARYPIFKDRNRIYNKNNGIEADRELDYFSFQFNGRTGVFVLDKNTNKGVSLGDNKLKISFTHNPLMTYAGKGIRTTINAFTIQDESGLIYRFSTRAIASVLKQDFCDADCVGQLVQPTFENGGIYHESGFADNTIVNPYIINSWYLTEIEDALTHRKVSFTYTYPIIETETGTSISYYQEKNYIVLSHGISRVYTPTLSSISTPSDDGHSIKFIYNSNERSDLKGAFALSDIDILYNDKDVTNPLYNRYISKYKLKTSYFILNRYGNPFSDYQKRVSRLCLRSVVKYSSDLKAYKEPYTFDYYLGSEGDDIVPPPFSAIKDIWGYYNGSNSQDFNGYQIPVNLLTSKLSELTFDQLKGLCFLRNSTGNNISINPKVNYAQNGLLKQIDYPGGGRLSYEYEQNWGVLNSSYQMVGGVHVLKTKLVDGGYSNDCAHPLVTNYSYIRASTSQSSLWGIESPVNSVYTSSHYEPESKYWTWKGGLFGSCRYRYQYPGILSRNQAIDLSARDQFLMSFGEIMSCVSTVLAVVDVINLCLVSSTGLAGAVIAVVLDVIAGLYSVFSTCFTGPPTDGSATNIFFNSDLNGTNPLPMQFNRVVVKEGDGSINNGKTVYTFTDPSTYPIWENQNQLYSMKQRYAYWAYGLPATTTVYDANGDKVKETENVYSYANAKRVFSTTPYAYPSCKCKVIHSSSLRDPNWNSTPAVNTSNYTITATSGADLQAERYDVYTGRVELAKTYERTYSGTTYLEQKKLYEYNQINYLVKRTLTFTSERIYCTDVTYSCDYSSGLAVNLNAANMLTVPITKVYSIAGGEESELSFLFAFKKMLREEVTEYTQLSSGDIKPLRTMVERTNEPVDEALWTPLYAGPGTTLNSIFKQTQKLTYDANGNAAGITDEGERFVTTKYDYNNKYAVATIANAEYGNDITAYTSFETNEMGGWSIFGTPLYSSQSITGSRGFDMTAPPELGGDGTPTTLSTAINTNKSYRLSFWASTGSSAYVGSVPVLVKSAPTINGFTYYEYEIPKNTISTVSITGTGIIDELRLYPVSARMRTTTYDPILGKTSECDENNRLTYYEYDEFGRLRFVKDDYHNIVKMKEYNVKKLGCTTTYTNKKITEIFVKNDCGENQWGTSETFVIPAGTFFSNVSQDEVDQMVENHLLLYGQVWANNVGTCYPIFYNTRKEADEAHPFKTETCEVGWVGGVVNYFVPAGRYTSKISQADADAKALADLYANGQNYANTDPHKNCVFSTTPVWDAEDGAPTDCRLVYVMINGVSTPQYHLFVQLTNINPHSTAANGYTGSYLDPDDTSSPWGNYVYNSTYWFDMGINCP